MEEYSIYRDYKKASDYNDAQRVNEPLRNKYMSDPEEMEYWRWYFKDKENELNGDNSGDTAKL